MRFLTSIDDLSQLADPVHLAIGVFDGVHRGHQAVLASAAERGQMVVATFDPHPAEVLAPGCAPKRLTSLAQQRALFQGLGAEATLAIPFDQDVAQMEASDFVEKLVSACALSSVHVGEDWAFGRGRRGDLSLLRDLGQRFGFSACGVSAVCLEGKRISSTGIRVALASGDLKQVEACLGRTYSLLGVVTQGKQLGRQLGFPTANVTIEVEALPPDGVYVVKVPLGEQSWPGVANLGWRPSVDESQLERKLEVHLLDWEGDLYGAEIDVEFHHRLRAEQRFDGLEALQTQIGLDLEEAKRWLASPI